MYGELVDIGQFLKQRTRAGLFVLLGVGVILIGMILVYASGSGV